MSPLEFWQSLSTGDAWRLLGALVVILAALVATFIVCTAIDRYFDEGDDE